MRPFQIILTVLLAAALSITASDSVRAWPEGGTLVAPAPDPDEWNDYNHLAMAADNFCEVFICWNHSYDGAIHPWNNFHTQGFNAIGDPLWSPDPVSLGSGIIAMAQDESGGIYITRHTPDPTLVHILGGFQVRHLHSDGSLVDVDFFDSHSVGCGRKPPMIISDGYTGAIVVWNEDADEEPPCNMLIKAQRIIDDTTVWWGSGGIVICDTCTLQAISSDGYGGVIIVYEDETGVTCAQRLDFDGNLLWGSGVLVCAEPGSRSEFCTFNTGTNDIVVSWLDERNPASGSDIYVQKIGADGSILWNAGGAPVCTAPQPQEYPACVTDGSGGAIVNWRDSRSGDYDIYAQRVDSDGNSAWIPDGLAVAQGQGNQRCPRICADGVGGALVAWVDESSGDGDIYCRAVDSDGGFLWGPGFVPICTAPGLQDEIVMARHCGGGAFIAWIDERSSDCGEVYATWITQPATDSPTPHLGEEIVLMQNRPNPFNPATTISFTLRSPGEVSLRIYDSAGRLVRTLVDGYRDEGTHTAGWDGTNDSGERISSSVYHCQLTFGGEKRSRKFVLLR